MVAMISAAIKRTAVYKEAFISEISNFDFLIFPLITEISFPAAYPPITKNNTKNTPEYVPNTKN